MTDVPNNEFAQLPLRRFIRDITDGPFGSSLTSSHYSDEGARVIRLGNIGAAHFKDGDAAYIPMEYFKHLRQHEVIPGDLIIAGLGDTNHPVGRACVAPDHLGPAIVKADCFRARLDEARLSHRYAAWALSSSFVSSQVQTLTRGSTRARINLDVAREIHVPTPPLLEQRRIADFLDAETARIDRLQRLRADHRSLVAERTRRRIEELATGHNRTSSPSTNPWIPNVPEGWQVIPLKRRWNIVDCKHRTPTYVNDGYPVISPGDISPGRLDLSTAHRFVDEEEFSDLADGARRPRRGDIVYSRNASVGIAAYVDSDIPFTMGQDVCRITSPEQDQLFLTYVLNSVALAELQSLQIGSTFTRINIGTLLELSIPCPPPSEQREISRRMDEVSAFGELIDRTMDRQHRLLAERRQALITAAVTGQFDVSSASGRGVDSP
jgi:type I restriction enzyme S subunit